MSKEGWNYATVYSSHQHYFINGKSLCGRFLLLGYKVFETANNPCSECLKILTRKKVCDFYGEGCSKCDKRKECMPIEN